MGILKRSGVVSEAERADKREGIAKCRRKGCVTSETDCGFEPPTAMW
jgi:hypothetical protein